ncbi:hypothetical protein ACHAXR_005936 [Thalassiosira sp. AJA248-18]
MKIQLAPFLATLSLHSSAAFQVNPVASRRSSSSSRAFVHGASSFHAVSTTTTTTTTTTAHHRPRQLSSSSTARQLAESVAEYDPISTTPAKSAAPAAAAPPATTTQVPHMVAEAQGEILSYLTTTTPHSSSSSGSSSSSSSSYAVVRVCEEDMIKVPALSTLTASGIGTMDGSVPMAAAEEEDKVELADALFSKSNSRAAAAAKNGQGVIADGDLTGRTVTFPNSSKGMVVAHRHPIAFVLVDNDSSASASGSGSSDNDGANNEISNSNERPLFVPIPKISDIGLIDSPLVTGITAIDALTPIGKGQNMLVIGEEEEDDVVGVNKRGWMINLLRNVVENHKKKSSCSTTSGTSGNSDISNKKEEEGGGSNTMRCFYGITSGDGKVRSSVWNGIKNAGIQDDVVTVVSTRDSNAAPEEEEVDNGAVSTNMALEAAEAVAVAAAVCTLGEHHALTTGGDSVVIIDDINLHKSLWDVTTQQLVGVYGVDAVVAADLNGGSSSEMRGFFSGLIQRAARFKTNKGGGSVTLILLSTLPNPDEDTTKNSEEEEPTFEAHDFDKMSEKIKTRISMLVNAKVPLTPTNLSKIQIPVPRPSATEDAKRLALQHVDDLISMSDGQIWLDDALAKQGRSPPIDPSRSLTRVGVGADTLTCRADAPALRSVVGSLRFEFQQAMDVLDSSSGVSSSSSSLSTTVSSSLVAKAAGDTTKQVQRRDAFLLAMHQEPNEVRKLSQECLALLAASRGHLDGVLANGGMAGTLEGKEAMEGLLTYVENESGEIMQSIDETLDLSLDDRNVLEEAIESYFK